MSGVTSFAPRLVVPIEGWAAIYETPDQSGDVVARGAFARSLKVGAADVKLLYQHAVDRPIGRWRRFEERAQGLYAHGELHLDLDAGREAHALVAGGVIDGLSVGFRTVRSAPLAAGRRILEAELWEVSLVTFPMAPAARIVAVGAPSPVDPLTEEPPLAALLRGAARSLTA